MRRDDRGKLQPGSRPVAPTARIVRMFCRWILPTWCFLFASSLEGGDLGSTLERIRAKHSLPGLAAAIVRGRVVEESAVVGVCRLGHPKRLQLDDRFHIASCTKSMTATLAAILVQEKRLDWSSRLVDVVPELRDTVRPEYRDATLEQLLAHAARMPAYTQFGPKRLEELKSIQARPPKSASHSCHRCLHPKSRTLEREAPPTRTRVTPPPPS